MQPASERCPTPYQRELAVAIDAARAAARIHVRWQGEELQGRAKSDPRDLVTRVDEESEARIRAILERAFPDDAVLGEEGGVTGRGRRRWIVDPLDGTLNYVHGFPAYAVSIGLEVDGAIEVGVVLDSARGELFTAVRGQGATANGAPMRASSCAVLAEAMVATGFAYKPAWRLENLALFSEILMAARCVRRPGAASLDLAHVAAGRLDGFWELYLSPWDVAAGSLLVSEAGGRVSSGAGPFAIDGKLIVAAGAAVHGELVRRLIAAGAAP